MFTSPTEAKKTHTTAAGIEGSYARNSGEKAITCHIRIDATILKLTWLQGEGVQGAGDT